MYPLDLGSALDATGRVLALVVSVLGLVVTISQLTRPALLKRREKWLREALAAETEANRLAYLRPRLVDTTSRIVGGMAVPGWRFLSLSLQMLIGPAQILIWGFSDPKPEAVVTSLLFSLIFVAAPIRRGLRLTAERVRIVHEYRTGNIVRPARVGILSTMEGGTGLEFTLAVLMSLGINIVAIGIALCYVGPLAVGIALLSVGIVLVGTLAVLMRRYVMNRVDIYGPWSVENARM
jgi:hypothetical protein